LSPPPNYLNDRFVSDIVMIIFIDPVFQDHLFGIFTSWQLLDQTFMVSHSKSSAILPLATV